MKRRQRLVTGFFQIPCLIILLVCCDSSESLFFAGPRRAIWSLIETLGGHKQVKPIHHYHMHYYPVPLPVFVPKHLPPPLPPPPPPPQKIEIELSGLHSGSSHDSLRSYGGGWPSPNDYGKIHDSDPILESPPSWDPWQDSLQHKSSAWDSNDLILDKDHGYKEAKAKGILLQVPLKQQIVFYQPPVKDNKPSLLSTLFKKIRRINDALFHPEDEENCTDKTHHDDSPHVTNSLTYANL